MSVLIPSQMVSPPLVLPDSPFQHLTSLSRADLAATRGLPAAERRLLTDHFVSVFQWETIRPLLPLQLELPPGVPLWHARVCRSQYIWLPPDDIHCADDLVGLDSFDLVLRLFDFSPWRAILGQRFFSAYGPPPFDPVSIGLAWLLARWRNWTGPQLLTELHSPERGLGYCLRLGFDRHDLPAESTFRVALDNTARSWILQCEDSLLLGLMAYGIIPTASTFPGDPPDRGVSIASDSQLVEARSQMLCHHQNAACFLPRTSRTCAARADGHDGCACDTAACADWANPCKHIAAVYYLLGERFDEEPFLLFELRGRDKDAAIAALRERRVQGAEPAGEAVYAPEMVEAVEAAALEKCLERYWALGHEVEGLALKIAEPKVEMALLKRLGAPAFEGLDARGFWAQMERVYGAVTRRALEVAFADAG